MNIKKWFILLVLPLFFACAHQKTAMRSINVIDNNGIRERAEVSEAELNTEILSKPAGNKPVVDYAPQTELEGVKIIKRTATKFEFEASGRGASSKYEKPIEAEKRAEDNALAKAAKAAGINVYTGSQDVLAQHGETQYQFVGRYLNVWASNLVESRRVAPAQCAWQGGVFECVVTIRGTVRYSGEADPNFELKAELDKPAYFTGDDVALSVRISKDSYLSIISCDEEGNAYLVFPNRYAQEGFVKSGTELRFPEDSSFKMTALLPQGRVETVELLHVIATKKQPLFMLNMLKEDAESGYVKYSLGGLKVISERLAGLPRSDWASQVLIYGIKAK